MSIRSSSKKKSKDKDAPRYPTINLTTNPNPLAPQTQGSGGNSNPLDDPFRISGSALNSMFSPFSAISPFISTTSPLAPPTQPSSKRLSLRLGRETPPSPPTLHAAVASGTTKTSEGGGLVVGTETRGRSRTLGGSPLLPTFLQSHKGDGIGGGLDLGDDMNPSRTFLVLSRVVKNGNLDELKKQLLLRGKKDEFVKLLSQIRGTPSSGADNGRTLLHVACSEGQLDIVKYLLPFFQVDVQDALGYTPLLSALERGQWKVAKWLLQGGEGRGGSATSGFDGASITAHTFNKDTTGHVLARALGVILDPTFEEVANFILSHLAKSQFRSYATAGTSSMLDMQEAKDLNTALHDACANGNLKIAVLLIRHGASLNIQNKEGETPLHIASKKGLKDIVQVLIEMGAELRCKSSDGFTPRKLAKEHNKKEIVVLLHNQLKNVSTTTLPAINDPDSLVLWIRVEETGQLRPIRVKRTEVIQTLMERLPESVIPNSQKSKSRFVLNGRILDTLMSDVKIQVTEGPNDFTPGRLQINNKCPFVHYFNEYVRATNPKKKARVQCAIKEFAGDCCLSFGDHMMVKLFRTLRVPGEVQVNTPPLLGALDVFSFAHSSNLHGELSRGGVLLPLYQSEACVLHFDSCKPFAVRVGLKKLNACTFKPTEPKLSNTPQDYIVTPPQHWIKGVSSSDKFRGQFVPPAKDLKGVKMTTELVLQIFPKYKTHVLFYQGNEKGSASTAPGHWSLFSSPKKSGVETGSFLYMKSIKKILIPRKSTINDFEITNNTELRLVTFNPLPLPGRQALPNKFNFNIVIQPPTTNSTPLNLTVKNNTTVKQIKWKVSKLLPSLPSHQLELRLKTAKQFLDENKTLHECGISADAVLVCHQDTNIRERYPFVVEAGQTQSSNTPQKLFADPYNNSWIWDAKRAIKVSVHLIDVGMFEEMTKLKPPRIALTPMSYSSHSIPWFPYYHDKLEDQQKEEQQLGKAANATEKTYDYRTFVL